MQRSWKTGVTLFAAMVMAVLFGLFWRSGTAQAANPATISFQGKVVNSDGTNVADGTYPFVFNLYTASSGGTSLWSESDSVSVKAGVFQVNLGANCSFFTAAACNNSTPIDFSTQSALYLGITFNSDPAGEMTPRVQLQSVPFAYQADNASKLGGLDASKYVQLSPAAQQTGNINVSGSATFGNGLTVSAGGAGITGNVTASGTLTVQGTGASSIAGSLGLGASPTYQLDLRSNTSSQLHLTSTSSDQDAYLLGSFGGFFASANAAWNGSWIAKATTASILQEQNGVLTFSSNTGLTAGSAFSPTSRFSVDGSGNLVVTGSLTAATATNTLNGLVVSSGALSKVTGITFTSGNFDQSASTAGTFKTGGGAISLNGNTTLATGKTLTVNGDSFTDLTGAALTNNSGALGVSLTASTTGDTTTGNASGMEIMSDGLSLLRGCSTGQILKWTTSGNQWQCQNDANTFSDSRLKTNVTDQANVLDTIKGLRVVTYNFKCTDPAYTSWKLDCDQHTGVIAQELQAVYPQAVTTDPNSGYYQINRDTIMFLMLKGVTQLATFIDDAGNAALNNVNAAGNLVVTGTTTLSGLGTGILHNTSGGTLSSGPVALGSETTGNYVATLGTLTGLSATGNTGAGSTPALSILYGSGANTAVQGNTTLSCASGTGNLTGGGTSITLGSGGTCGSLNVISNPSFTGTVGTSTGYKVGSSTGITTSCGNNQYLNASVVVGGIVTGFSSCSGVGLSDERVKTNVVSLDSSVLDSMQNVNPVSFDFDCSSSYFSESNTYCDPTHQAGVIAQQLQSIFPELVSQDSYGYYHVNYQGLSAYTLKAVSELAQHIDSAGNATLNDATVNGTLKVNGTLEYSSAGAPTGNFSTSVITPHLTSSGALRIDSGSSGDVTIDTGGNSAVVNIGGQYAGAVSIARAGTPTTIKGSLLVNQDADFLGNVNFDFTGGHSLNLSTDLSGNVSGLNVIATPSATAGATSGIAIRQASSSNANGLDSALAIDNADPDLPVGSAITISNSGGGGYEKLINSPNFQVGGDGSVVAAGSVSAAGFAVIAPDGSTVATVDVSGNASFKGNLNMAGASLSGGLYVGGDATFAGLSTFQKLATFVGKTVFKQDVEFQGHITVSGDSAGYASLRVGESIVHVTFKQPYAQAPIVSAAITSGQFGLYSIDNVTTDGFDIALKTPATEATTFSWTAVGVNDPQTATNPLPATGTAPSASQL